MREGPRGSPVHSGPGLRGFGWSVALFFLLRPSGFLRSYPSRRGLKALG